MKGENQMVKNLKAMTIDCRKVLNLLNNFSQEVGAYGVASAWMYKEKLVLQCNPEKLKIWLEENSLEFNSSYIDSPAYETEYFILFGM